MLIVNIENNTPIDKALKLFKSKVIKTKLMSEIRKRKEFTKPSVLRRNEVNKAIYVGKNKNNLF